MQVTTSSPLLPAEEMRNLFESLSDPESDPDFEMELKARKFSERFVDRMKSLGLIKSCRSCQYNPPVDAWPCSQCSMDDYDKWEPARSDSDHLNAVIGSLEKLNGGTPVYSYGDDYVSAGVMLGWLKELKLARDIHESLIAGITRKQ